MAILEVRLNKLKIRDAEAMHFNDGLKREINDLRKKRMVINSSHQKVRPPVGGARPACFGPERVCGCWLVCYQYEQWLLETRRKIKELTEKASRANEEREKVRSTSAS